MAVSATRTVRLKVSPQVAQILAAQAPHAAKLQAARGELPLSGRDLLTALFFFCSSDNAEIRAAALQSLRDMSEASLLPLLADPDLHPQLLGLLVRIRLNSLPLMDAILRHPAVPRAALLHLAATAGLPVLQKLAEILEEVADREPLVAALLENPRTDDALRQRFSGGPADSQTTEVGEGTAAAAGERNGTDEEQADARDDAGEDVEDVDVSELMAEAEEKGASKYQIALNLRVAEKIKVALTGDKEWRSIMIKDANKLVQGAVMKNPRITDGEVLAIAKNKTASDDLIRQILLNKDWMKLYEIKKALAIHPKTPPPKAIRLISLLNTKDVKDLMRSKGVSTVVATTARKEFENRQRRIGG